MVHIGNDWDEILKDEWEKPYYKRLRAFLKQEYTTRQIFPDMHDIFNALKYTSFENTRVVILGQDPYHGIGQAHGLCFSVKKGIEPPPSLKNIFQELNSDLGIAVPSHGELTAWAKQGVLMLNTVLTVRANNANSHQGMGWETFTDRVIAELDRKETPVVFLLWGNPARRKAESYCHCRCEGRISGCRLHNHRRSYELRQQKQPLRYPCGGKCNPRSNRL